jgi:PAS domain-containing protein
MRDRRRIQTSTHTESCSPELTRDQAQELLHQKEARLAAERKYRRIFENVSEGVFQSTPDG